MHCTECSAVWDRGIGLVYPGTSPAKLQVANDEWVLLGWTHVRSSLPICISFRLAFRCEIGRALIRCSGRVRRHRSSFIRRIINSLHSMLQMSLSNELVPVCVSACMLANKWAHGESIVHRKSKLFPYLSERRSRNYNICPTLFICDEWVKRNET